MTQSMTIMEEDYSVDHDQTTDKSLMTHTHRNFLNQTTNNTPIGVDNNYMKIML